MTKFDDVASSTVRISCGNELGSGFHFIRPDVIVSNAHVVEPLIAGTATAFAEAETGQRWSLTLSAHSPPNEFDYAIMAAKGANFDARRALHAGDSNITGRGLSILYAGYPHGLDPLLVANSNISAPIRDKSFCFDGMIHGGNSGGPVVDANTLAVIGIVTRRRFIGDPEMKQIDQEMSGLQNYLVQIRNRGNVQLMGINFTEFALAMSRIASITNEIIRRNSTTGIGFAYPIGPIQERCKNLGI